MNVSQKVLMCALTSLIAVIISITMPYLGRLQESIGRIKGDQNSINDRLARIETKIQAMDSNKRQP